MASEKKRRGRGKNITSALELLDSEPYRTIIEIIDLFGVAEPRQIIYVSNNENEKELTQQEREKVQRRRRINRYKNGNEVKQLIHSRSDNPPLYPLNSDNLKKFLNTLIQWGIVEKIERGRYQIAPSLKNEIIRKSNKKIIDYYARDDISDFSESDLVVYGFEYLRKHLEGADRSECGQKLLSKRLSEYPDIYWFSISTKFEEDLNKGVVPQELRDKGKAAVMIELRRIEEWWEKKDSILMQYSKWLPRILSLSDNATITKIQDWCLLFHIDAKFEDDLNKNIFPEELKNEFKSYFKRMYNKKSPFSDTDNTTVTKGKGNEWQIGYEISRFGAWKRYITRKEGDKLNIYNSYAAQMSIDKEWIIEDGEKFVARKEGNKLNIYHDLVLHGEKELKELHTPIQDLRLFSIDAKFEENLNKNIFPEELKNEFKSYFKRMYDEEAPFSDNATVTKGEGNEWQIGDEGEQYIIRKEDDELKIYNSCAVHRRIGKDHIDIIQSRIDKIKHELKELRKEKMEATEYLDDVHQEYWKKHEKELDEFTEEKKKKFWDKHPNFRERTLGIMFGVEETDEKYLKDYEKYVKEKLIHPYLTPPTPPPLFDITLFYSEKLGLNLPSSVEVAIAAASWNSDFKAFIDETISEEELEKSTKKLYQKYGYEIQKVVSNAICFAYYAGKFGPIYKGKK